METFEDFIAKTFAGKEVERLRVNIMSAGLVVNGIELTREVLAKMVAGANARRDILAVSAAASIGSGGVLGYAHDLELEGDDVYAELAFAKPAPHFKRGAGVMAVLDDDPVLVAVLLTNLEREDILRLNQEPGGDRAPDFKGGKARLDKWAVDGLDIVRDRFNARGGLPRSAFILALRNPQSGELLDGMGTVFVEDGDTPDDTFFSALGELIERSMGEGVIVAWADENVSKLIFLYRACNDGNDGQMRTWKAPILRRTGQRPLAGAFVEVIEADDLSWPGGVRGQA